jgi:hypothetical protein
MYSIALFSVSRGILASPSRFFSSSTSLAFPKLKTHSGTKKRWTSLPNGLFKRVRTCAYLLTNAHTDNSGCTGESWTSPLECHERSRSQEQTWLDCTLESYADSAVEKADAIRLRNIKIYPYVNMQFHPLYLLNNL